MVESDIANPQPIRFQHIDLTAQTSLTSLLSLVALRDLRTTLEALDDDIASLRQTINPVRSSPSKDTDGTERETNKGGKYDQLEDVGKLERLVKAKEKTKLSLEGRVGWAGLEEARAEAVAAGIMTG